MKRTRSKSLGNLVIAKADLKSIWALLERHAASDADFIAAQQKTNPTSYFAKPERPEISISSAGSMTTEADNEAVFDNDVIDLEKSDSIRFSYSNYRQLAKSIRISLEEGTGFFSSSNSFSVSGQDPAWVDATFVELERLFNSIKPQTSWFRRYVWVVRTILAISLGFSLGKVLNAISSDTSSGPSPAWVTFIHMHPPALAIAELAAFFLIGIGPAYVITLWVGQLWPSIEFDFGPEHLKRRKNIRVRLTTVFVLAVLPLVIEAFTRFGLGWH